MKLMDKYKKLYTEGDWYDENYKLLGSDWLLNSLDKLNLKKNYILINLSANKGFYERDVFKIHKNIFNPIYYIGDLYVDYKEITDKINDERFYYLERNDATERSIIDVTGDVIIDTKGALWHTIDAASWPVKCIKIKLKKLLTNYYNMMRNDDSVLLIDCYEVNTFKYIYHILVKKSRKKYFQEKSTYTYLRYFFGNRRVNKYIEKLNIRSCNEMHPLGKLYDTAIIDRKNLKYLIDEIDKIPNIIIKYKIKRIIPKIKEIL